MAELGGVCEGRMTRRDALKRGAVVAGSAMWVAPVVQALAVNHASAEQPSGGLVDVDSEVIVDVGASVQAVT